jgi:CRP-like cAMP-binding protein
MSDRGFMELAERTLGGVNLVAGVATDTVIALGDKAWWRRCPPGTVLMRAGEVRSSFFSLVHGSARLQYRDARRDLVAEAGETLGIQMAFFDGPAWATARTTTPALIAEIARLDLLHAMATSPALATNVGRMLAARSDGVEPREQLDTQILKALARAVDGVADGGEAPLPAPIDPAVWATLLGVDKSDVERALTRLKRHRIVRHSPSGVQYVDLDRLSERLR